MTVPPWTRAEAIASAGADNQLIELDDGPVLYAFITQPPHGHVGALLLRERDHGGAFIPATGHEECASGWWERIRMAQKPAGDFRPGFKYWTEEANGITWGAGPILKAVNGAAVRTILRLSK